MNIYQIPQKFTQCSKLHRYLAIKCPEYINIRKRDYALYQIMLALKLIITREKLYDKENPTIIICDDILEDALEVRALHVSDTKEYITKQCFPITQEEQADVGVGATTNNEPDRGHFTLPCWASTSANAVVARANAVSNCNAEDKFTVKPDFLKVLRTVPGFVEAAVFTYTEICKLLSAYIMANKDKFFDVRNNRVALVENDLLGKAFGVQAFARSQVTSLLRSQLIPYQELAVTNQTGLQQGDEIVETNSSPSNANENTEETTYTVEYEVVSDTDSTDLGKSNFYDDSEIEDVKIDSFFLQDTDGGYGGDVEVGETEDANVEIKTSVKKKRACLGCHSIVDSIVKYCQTCWQERKTWFPQYKKSERGTRKRHLPDVPDVDETKVAKNESDNLCNICFNNPNDASFIHGQSSHQVCCYSCAKRIYKRKDPCPICRRKIEKIVKNF